MTLLTVFHCLSPIICTFADRGLFRAKTSRLCVSKHREVAVHARSHYETNCGQYVLHDTSGRPIHKCLEEVAIAFALDSENQRFILHKHGDPEWVHQWAKNAKEKLSAAGPLGQQMADEIQVIQGAFPLAVLNGALEGREPDMRTLFGIATPIDVTAKLVDAPRAAKGDITSVRRLSPR